MSRLPFVVRVAAGAVALAAEKGQEIATGAVTAPLTLGSKSAQAVIKVQQDLAGLAVRGDSALELLFPPRRDEQAQWATFDDDEDVEVELPDTAPGQFGAVRRAVDHSRAESAAAADPESDGDDGALADDPPVAGSGRYALYSSPAPTEPQPVTDDPVVAVAAEAPEAAAVAAVAPVVARIDYSELTLAQLRGRLPKLTKPELTELLAYEQAHRARTPFLTMLETRLKR